MSWLVTAIGGAACLGSGNFLGGRAARSGLPSADVALVSHCLGALLLLAITILTTPTLLAGGTEPIAALGGLASASATVLLYRSLRLGQMSVNAPVVGVISILTATVAGVMEGETLRAPGLAGIALAVAAVIATSQSPGPRVGRLTGGVPEAIGAGIGFGLFSICLSVSSGGAAETLLIARLASVGLLAVLAVRGFPQGPVRSLIRAGLPVGGLEFAGNALMFVALAQGTLSVVQTLLALNPVVTVLLARTAYGEHLSRWQRLGSVAAIASIPLLALNQT